MASGRGCGLGDFLKRVGADLTAKFVAFQTSDNYPSSIDMATALHPQTLLATGYGGDTRTTRSAIRCACAPSTKLGFKKPQVDHLAGGDQQLSRRLLGEAGLQLVQRHLKPAPRRAAPALR